MKDSALFKSLLLIILFLPTIVFAQSPLKIDEKFPEGKKGELIEAFIEVINNQKKEVEFLDKNANAINRKELAANIFQLRNLTGGIKFKGTFNSKRIKENQTILIIEDENYTLWRGLSITFSDTEDYQIERFKHRLFPKSEQGEIATSKMIKTIAETVEKLGKKDLFSGTVLVAEGDKILYEKAIGEASKRFHVANNEDTKFNIASIGKMFTAVSIMQLVEQDKLKLDDAIIKYVDTTWTSKDILNKVTVRQLLSHTSGLGSYFNDAFFNASKENFRNLEDFKTLVVTDTLQFEPGTQFRYSNSGFLLLGVIIEQISGLSYEAYLTKNIFGPAGMINSGLYEMDQPVENLAIGYIKSANNMAGWENNLFQHVIKGGPAGGGYSTIGDLHQFILALKKHQLLSKNSLSILWTKPSKIRVPYGLGFRIVEKENSKQIGHSGGAPGITAEVIYDMNKEYISVVLSNYEDGDQLSFLIRALLNQVTASKTID